MRLARLVAAGLVLGAVVGFVTALVRPRGSHRTDHAAPVPVAGQVGPTGAGSDLPTQPFPLPIQPELSGTGGAR